MKAVTEFPTFILVKGIAAKTALTAESKSPEEIEKSLGESFKFENPKLKYFVAAIDVAAQNQQDLKRVLVLSLNENEVAPPKAVKVEEHHYVPEFIVMAQIKPQSASHKGGHRGGGPGGKGKSGGPKSSPWGLSPEEKAAKGKGKSAPKK
jgi:hypothetical protein